MGLLAGLAEPRLAKARNWSLEELAATVGTTPGGYLAEWRVGVAQSLLRQSKPVQLVSDVVGYGSALARAFRAQIGRSPTEWLKCPSPGPI